MATAQAPLFLFTHFQCPLPPPPDLNWEINKPDDAGHRLRQGHFWIDLTVKTSGWRVTQCVLRVGHGSVLTRTFGLFISLNVHCLIQSRRSTLALMCYSTIALSHLSASASASISTLSLFSLHLCSVGCRPSCPQRCCSMTKLTVAPLHQRPPSHPAIGCPPEAFTLIGWLEGVL